MYLGTKDLELLIRLENKLGEAEGWSDDVTELWKLIERLQVEKQRLNEKSWAAICERRKADPNYGRSKKQIREREEAAKRREERKKAKEKEIARRAKK